MKEGVYNRCGICGQFYDAHTRCSISFQYAHVGTGSLMACTPCADEAWRKITAERWIL